MRRTLIVATCVVFAAVANQAAHAAMIAGQYVPDSLVGQTGKQYRLIFVTSGSIRAQSDDPLVYDNFLAGQVLGTMLGDYDYGWKAVVSTEGADPTDRHASSIVSDAAYGVDLSKYLGVYNAAGIRVAATGDAMLTGSLLSPVAFDQHGTSVYDGYAWTGSFANGEPAITVPPAQVGDDSGYTMLGAPGANDGRWLQLGAVARGDLSPIPFVARIYGMSDVMTVPVPEPATIVLWSLFTGAAGLVFWRKRRHSN